MACIFDALVAMAVARREYPGSYDNIYDLKDVILILIEKDIGVLWDHEF